jgi:hypothetical protein
MPTLIRTQGENIDDRKGKRERESLRGEWGGENSDLLNYQNAEGSAARWNRCIFPIAGAVCAALFGCSAAVATMARA